MQIDIQSGVTARLDSVQNSSQSDLHDFQEHSQNTIFRFLATRKEEPLRIFQVGIPDDCEFTSWETQFRNAHIIGIDCNDAVRIPLERTHVLLGNTSDLKFLQSAVTRFRDQQVDIVFSRARNSSEQESNQFSTLFPLLTEGGLYIVPKADGAGAQQKSQGHNSPSDFLAFLSTNLSMLGSPGQRTAFQRELRGIHFTDGFNILEKGPIEREKNGKAKVVTDLASQNSPELLERHRDSPDIGNPSDGAGRNPSRTAVTFSEGLSISHSKAESLQELDAKAISQSEFQEYQAYARRTLQKAWNLIAVLQSQVGSLLPLLEVKQAQLAAFRTQRAEEATAMMQLQQARAANNELRLELEQMRRELARCRSAIAYPHLAIMRRVGALLRRVRQRS